MYRSSVVVFCLTIAKSWSMDNVEGAKFPPEFKFGVATAAYQIEGAWNVSDKSENVWDSLLHTQPSVSADGSNGNIACDSYHLWERDIEMLEELGVDMYSEDGTRYYNNLIDRLLAKGIEPVVTLYHFDLPQSLQDLGGWANPLVVDWFADYAYIVFSLFGDRIKTWITINEPLVICDGAYNKFWAPYLDDMEIGAYLCNKNVMMAHAKAYRIYVEEFKHRYNGKLSISNILQWFVPETPADSEAVDLSFQMWEGRYAHPIYSKAGGWPPALEKVLNDKAKQQGYPYPRLPPFTKDEIEFVKGTFDFYAFNYYASRLVRRVKPELAGHWLFYGNSDLEVSYVSDPSWTAGDIDWFGIYPEGLRKQLHWINNTYGVNNILITENGLPTFSPDMYDAKRINYLREHLEQVLLAINDGIPVVGYTAWSLMDNFEWLGGYTTKFGLYSVDFSSPQRTRTPRDSARYFSTVIRTRSLNSVNQLINYL